MAAGRQVAKAADDLTDLEDDEAVDEANQKPAQPDAPGIAVDRKAVESELALVESFVKRAKSLPHDAKARSFQDAIRVVLDESTAPHVWA